MRVAVLQLETAWHDPAANAAKAKRLIAEAAADLAVLPEMFDHGFSMDTAAVTAADEVDVAALSAGGHVLAGVARRDGPANAAVLADARGEIGRYVKCRPFPLCREADHYPAGREVAVFDLHGFTLCPLICYDLRWPELWRGTGATLFACLANWPATRREHWLALLRARAIENQAYVVGCNRCGADPNVDYSGDSVIYGPLGETLAHAGDREQTLTGDLDPAQVARVRRDFPFLTP